MTATIISLADRRRARRDRQLAEGHAELLLMPYRGFVMSGIAVVSWALFWWLI